MSTGGPPLSAGSYNFFVCSQSKQMDLERDVPLTVFKPHVQTYAIVYSSTGDYDLLGHGFLSIISDEIEEETVNYLEVESVQDAEVLLRSRLKIGNNYEKQRGSVIAWTDSEQRQHHDIAISFEGDKQCDVIWRMICEKIGKNYLEINGRETLNLPSENNLPYILEKTRTSKDMMEYNLLNNPKFLPALIGVFESFKEKKDKMGQGMMGRIVRSIFSNIDHRMVQAFFKDPTFSFVLEVQKFLQEVDFPRMWAESIKIRSIVPMNAELTTKIHLTHRLNFYRENILDLKMDGYLENILVMTQQEFSKDIIIYLTKQNTIEELINLTYQSAQEKQLLVSDPVEEETFHSETEEIRNLQFAEKKVEFILEAVIIAKQMDSQNVKVKFFDKIFKSGFMELSSEFMDKGVLKALDFFNCFAQLTPLKFVEYLRTKYRQSPSDNLHSKLSRKYNLGNEQTQHLILQLVKSLSQSFKIKQNLDFFMGTFFATVFGCCREVKPILHVVSEIQNLLQNVESFFGQTIKSKVFQKMVVYLRNAKQDKRSEISAIKILKRVLLENADSSWMFKKIFLNDLNQQIIKSGYFDYCMTVLEKNIRFNNVISSSMLENIKIIREMKRYTPFHKQLQNNYKQSESLSKYLGVILATKEEDTKTGASQLLNDERVQQIEQEKQEAYLMSQMHEQLNYGEALKDSKDIFSQLERLENVRQMRKEIEQAELQELQVERFAHPGKKIKPNEEEIPITIQLDLPFDEDIGEVK